MEEKQNYKLIIIVIIVSVVIFVGWDAFILKPIRDNIKNQQVQENILNKSSSQEVSNFKYTVDSKQILTDKQSLASLSRIKIITDSLKGSINLIGATIDSATLLKYKETIDKNSDNVSLLHPKNTYDAYFYQSGFVSNNNNIDMPNNNTKWTSNDKVLTEKTPVILTYKNKQGIIFKKKISIDNDYMIKVEDTIINNTNTNINIYPWALIVRQGEPKVQDIFISHEGVVGYINNSLEQLKYKDILKKGEISYSSNSGFFGFADKYFMVSIIPNSDQNINVQFRYFLSNDNIPKYQADYSGVEQKIYKNEEYHNVTNLFVGPKEYNLLKNYGSKYNITKFDDSIDFGWFYFITKPFLSVLLWFYNYLHNFGYAMLAFTIIIRLLIFPITYTSYSSMAKMKKIQPQMKLLKEKHAGDMQKYNHALMALYKKEKVNPIAGCLPLLLQIPILFSIYKVIYICIEMRQAPFFWIKDLSAPDPTSVFNLFGLLPYSLPQFLNIGFWAIFMGLTMFFQQKLSNTTFVNETQKRLMTWFPVIITIILAHFPVGLLIYWSWSNLISILQQLIINRIVKKRHGY